MSETSDTTEMQSASIARFTLQKVKKDDLGIDKIAYYLGPNGLTFKVNQSRPERGALSMVYFGTLPGGLVNLRNVQKTGVEKEVVVKLPLTKEAFKEDAPGWTDTDYEEWRKDGIERNVKEAQLLKRLRQKQQELFPGSKPHFCDAEVATLDNVLGVVMEKAGTTLVGLVTGERGGYSYAPYRRKPDTPPISEDQLNQAMIQYFETLATAHALDVSVGDKKGSDLRYDPEENRLIILDWNVTAPASEILARSGATGAHIDVAQGIRFYIDLCESYGLGLPGQNYSVSSDKLQELKLISNDLKNKVNQITALDMIRILKNLNSTSGERPRR